jgi:hypothetical protein
MTQNEFLFQAVGKVDVRVSETGSLVCLFSTELFLVLPRALEVVLSFSSLVLDLLVVWARFPL